MFLNFVQNLHFRDYFNVWFNLSDCLEILHAAWKFCKLFSKFCDLFSKFCKLFSIFIFNSLQNFQTARKMSEQHAKQVHYEKTHEPIKCLIYFAGT